MNAPLTEQTTFEKPGLVKRQPAPANRTSGWKISIIAAAFSTGTCWFSLNHGSNNQVTVWLFLLKEAEKISAEDRSWRDHYRFVLDGASYHKSDWISSKIRELQLPVLYIGPYAFDLAPVERVFAYIKCVNLNSTQKNLSARSGVGLTIETVGENIMSRTVPDIKGMYRKALRAAENYMLL